MSGAATLKERDKAARDVVNLCSYGCAVVAVSPIPFSDAIVMLPIQSAMSQNAQPASCAAVRWAATIAGIARRSGSPFCV